MQHKMAVVLSKFFLDKNDSEEEALLTTFGIEIFLNEFLKFLLIAFLGLLLGHFSLTIICLFFVFLSRRIIKGGHFKTNYQCTLYTIFSCLVAPVLILYVDISSKVLYAEILLVIVSIPFFCSYDREMDKRDYKRAIIDIGLFITTLVLVYFFKGEKNMSSIVAAQICTEVMCERKHPTN